MLKLSIARFPQRKLTRANSSGSSVGASVLRWWMTNTARRTVPPATKPIVCQLAHPTLSDSTSPNRMALAAPASRATPANDGIRTSGSRDSWRYRVPAMIVATPTGRLMKNAQRHPKASIMRAPSEGPSAADNAPIAPQMAITWGSLSFGNAAITRARDAGTKIAAPAPWTTRAPINNSADGAMPQANDAIENVADPTRKARR